MATALQSDGLLLTMALLLMPHEEERVYPELSGDGGRTRLVVLTAEVGNAGQTRQRVSGEPRKTSHTPRSRQEPYTPEGPRVVGL